MKMDRRNNIQIKSLSIRKDLIKKLEEKATYENRSLSNLVETILLKEFDMLSNKCTQA